ncbi:uncharacterized protein HD556DRAFT_1246636, partial [Suillus plorans]
DAVIQLLSSLMLSPDDAHNLIRVVVDSTKLQSPSTMVTPQCPAPHPTTQIHLTASPIVQTLVLNSQTPAPTSQTPVPTARTKSPLVQQYNGFPFDVPHADANGPFYLITRGRRVGVFDTWPRTSPHVIGVKTSSYSRAWSLDDGILHIMDAIDLGEAVWLPWREDGRLLIHIFRIQYLL